MNAYSIGTALVLLTLNAHAMSINHRRLAPRHSVFAQLNDFESDFPPLTDPVDYIPEPPTDYDDDDEWSRFNESDITDNINWLEDALAETKNETLTNSSSSSSSLVDNFMDMISEFLTNTNTTASFTFITHIQLKPRSCPSDVTKEFDQAIRKINPGISVQSTPIRAGDVSCKGESECPCSDSLSNSLSRRKLVIPTLEIMTTVNSAIQMPSDLSFSYKVVPVK